MVKVSILASLAVLTEFSKKVYEKTPTFMFMSVHWGGPKDKDPLKKRKAVGREIRMCSGF